MSEQVDYYIKLGVAVRIPMAFKRFCKDNYQLKKIPLTDSSTSEEEAKINIRYEIHSEENKIASFTPAGEYLCFEDDFKPIFDQIVEELGYAAYKAKKAQEEHDERIMKQMDEKFNLKD
ncbi:MAG: hypothetical protein FK733_04240 [Asgard group archaeon]|nr:hypothetical protein [Asgard group archaeon]